MQNRVTIYDVAKAADVSLATVSRVINNNPAVKESTRKIVEETMKSLGYRPNEVARGLALAKSTNICIITASNMIQLNEKLMKGVMDVARIYKYNIFLHTVSKGITNMEDIIENIIKRQINGVILFKGQFSDKELSLFEENDIPVIVIGTYVDIQKYENLGNVYVDFEEIGHEIAKKYLDQNIDDIGFVFDIIHEKTSQLIVNGIQNAFHEKGKHFDRIIRYEVENDSSFFPLKERFKNTNPSKLWITIRDTHALALVQAYMEQGYEIPNDFEVINVLDSKYLHMCHPQITSYGIPDYDMGAIGCRLLTKLLEKKDLKDLQIKVSQFLYERETTKNR